MVGLKDMESKRPDCAFCRATSNTNCDKTQKPVCPKCSTIIPKGETVSIIAKKHAPKKHIAKLQELAIKRGEVYEV
mgnify:FL=1